MDFIVYIGKPGLSDEEVQLQIKIHDNWASANGLLRLDNGERRLPFWGMDPALWKVTPEIPGGGRNVSAKRLATSATSFQVLCSSSRTTPVLHFAEGGGGSVASDQLGIAPIYWVSFPSYILAASRSSFLVELENRRLDLNSVFHYLNFSTVPTPFSILQGVNRLAPGCILEVGSEVRQKTFWNLRYAEKSTSSANASAPALFEKIRDAVHRTAEGGDVSALGAFLSGGTDSTTVAAFAAEAIGQPLDVFSIIFEDQAVSEEPFMQAAAQRFPLRRHSFQLDQAAFLNALEPIRNTYDEPYANSSVYAAYYCFQMARDAGKKCLLAGDGGDEIFGGNERYLKDRFFATYAALPSWLKVLWEFPLESIQVQSHAVNRLRKMFRRARMPNPDRFYADTEFASAHWNELPGPAFRDCPIAADASLQHVRELYRHCTAGDELHRLLYLDMKLTIADNDLMKITRCGAMFGIEPRFPFLDLELVEYANQIPASLKLKWLQKRYLFKKAMRGYLPDEILFKRKQGMGLPLGSWLRDSGPVSVYAKERLMDKAAGNLFSRRYLDKIWAQHLAGEWDYSEDLWRIVVLVDWCATHGSIA